MKKQNMFKNFHRPVILALVIGFLFSLYPVGFTTAQDEGKITLTISPPLVSVRLNPGERYTSFVKLVNNNSVGVTVFVQAADFKSGDQGMVEFVGTDFSSNRYSLANWLEFATGTLAIAAQETKDIIFTINVPADAEPGGHYAAIMAGTKPVADLPGSGIKISSTLASLILLEVSGNIVEQGDIKEFSSSKKVYSESKVKLNVTFANSGNIHLQPRGEIKIYNIFNKEVGSIPINQETIYGNVFPESQRKWEFSWNGRNNILDMGRLKAVLFLSYGNKAEVTMSRTIYFWVIYFKTLALMLLGLIALIAIVMLSIRRYIRRAIIRAQVNAGIVIRPNSGVKHKISIIPMENGSHELKTDVKVFQEKDKLEVKDEEGLSTFKKFFLGTLSALILVSGVAAFLYYRGYLPSFGRQKSISNTINNEIVPLENSSRESEKVESSQNSNDQANLINITEDDKAITSATGSDILPVDDQSSLKASSTDEATSTANREAGQEAESNYTLIVLNGSGQEGAAKRAQDKIGLAGYKVNSIGNADNYDYINTVLQYKKKSLAMVENISEIFGKNIELQEITDGQADIIVIVGRNFK